MKKLTLITLWIISMCAVVLAQTKSETVNVAGTDIKMPIKLVWIDGYRDGGTIGATVEDASGKNIDFCIDKIGGGDFKNIYLWAKHPNMKTANTVQLSIAGSEEKNLLKVLQSWKEANEKNSYLLTELIEEIERRNFPKRFANKTKSDDKLVESPIDFEEARKLTDEFVDNLINDRRDKIKAKLDREFYWSNFDGNEEKQLNHRVDFMFRNHGWKPLECKFERDKTSFIYDDGRKIPARRFLYVCKTTNPESEDRSKDWVRVVKVSVVQTENQLFIRNFFLGLTPTALNPNKEKYGDPLDGNF